MSEVEAQDVRAVPEPRPASEERLELDRLLAEVATRRTQRPPRRTVRWRGVAAVVLVVLGRG